LQLYILASITVSIIDYLFIIVFLGVPPPTPQKLSLASSYPRLRVRCGPALRRKIGAWTTEKISVSLLSLTR